MTSNNYIQKFPHNLSILKWQFYLPSPMSIVFPCFSGTNNARPKNSSPTSTAFHWPVVLWSLRPVRPWPAWRSLWRSGCNAGHRRPGDLWTHPKRKKIFFLVSAQGILEQQCQNSGMRWMARMLADSKHEVYFNSVAYLNCLSMPMALGFDNCSHSCLFLSAVLDGTALLAC